MSSKREKVFCKDCQHIIKPSGALYEPHPESICNNSMVMDYVIGERKRIQCKAKNTVGICVDFLRNEINSKQSESHHVAFTKSSKTYHYPPLSFLGKILKVVRKFRDRNKNPFVKL
jgi:hypothetical protein